MKKSSPGRCKEQGQAMLSHRTANIPAMRVFKSFSALSSGFLAKSCCSGPDGAHGGAHSVWLLPGLRADPHSPSPEHKPKWGRGQSRASWLGFSGKDR